MRSFERFCAVVIILMTIIGGAQAGDGSAAYSRLAALIKPPLGSITKTQPVYFMCRGKVRCKDNEACCMAGSGIVPLFPVCCEKGCGPPGYGCKQ
jgi:hypothetical protein